jgi:hypothetical protein
MASRALSVSPEKRGTSQPADPKERNLSETVSENAIAARAYQLWQDRGRPVGSDQRDWFCAEKELKDREGLAQFLRWHS